ncbi:hypothetical protein ACFOUP_04505, partial [Belliella kenyensis]
GISTNALAANTEEWKLSLILGTNQVESENLSNQIPHLLDQLTGSKKSELGPRHAENSNPQMLGRGSHAQTKAKTPKVIEKQKQPLPKIHQPAYYST